MKIQMYLDDVLCEGEISKINQFHSLISMALHPTDWGKWRYFKVTNIKGNFMYESWDYIRVYAGDINWNFLRFY